jgi:hypothetical protein
MFIQNSDSGKFFGSGSRVHGHTPHAKANATALAADDNTIGGGRGKMINKINERHRTESEEEGIQDARCSFDKRQ